MHGSQNLGRHLQTYSFLICSSSKWQFQLGSLVQLIQMMSRCIFGYIPFSPTWPKVSRNQHFSFWVMNEKGMENGWKMVSACKRIVNKALPADPYRIINIPTCSHLFLPFSVLQNCQIIFHFHVESKCCNIQSFLN